MHGDKIVDWGTPKSLQKSKEDNRYHNKNKQCKVYKGEHQFTEKTIENNYWGKPWMIQWRCKCGKKGKYEWIEKPKWMK